MNLDIAVKEVARILTTGRLRVFVGAGLSKPAGLSDWKQLVTPYAKELEIDVNKENPLRIMQYFAGNNQANRSRVMEDLRHMLKDAKIQSTHYLIARLRLPRIWTTNYDELLENAYRDEGIDPEIISTDDQLADASYLSPQIIKMHGDLKNRPIVLLEEDYEHYERERLKILNLFQHDIQSCSVLFLGVSFDDPNLRKVAASLQIPGKYLRPHYLLTALLPRIRKRRYELSKYNLWKQDLPRFRINVVELKSFDEIEYFISGLLKTVYGAEVVISGSFVNDTYNLLCNRLGRKLAEKNFKIYTGGGDYAGTVVAEGAWEEFDRRKIKPYKKIEFLYREGGGSTNPQKGRVTYIGGNFDEMRKHLISSDRICIVLGGKGGTEEEVNIARSKGCPIVPIGMTGGTAQKVWKGERSHYLKSFKEMLATFELLNKKNADPSDIVDATVKLVDFLSYRRVLQ